MYDVMRLQKKVLLANVRDLSEGLACCCELPQDFEAEVQNLTLPLVVDQ